MSEYFSHDYNARNDLRMKKLTMGEGMEGVGVYWCLIEMLYERNGYIDLSEIDVIAFDLRTDCERIARIISDYDLFLSDDKKFFSESVLKRLKMRDEKSKKAKASALKRWSSNASEESAMRTHTESNAIKENKRKENKRKINIYQIISDMYNEICISFPKCTKMSDSRMRTIKARLNSGYTEEDFKKLFQAAEASRFLKGGNNRNWQANFDWLIKDSNMAKVLDGNYSDKNAEQEKSGIEYFDFLEERNNDKGGIF